MLTLFLNCSSLQSSERRALALYHTPTVVLVSIRGPGFWMGPFHVHLSPAGDLQCGCRGFRVDFFSLLSFLALFSGSLSLPLSLLFLECFGPHLSVSPLPGFQYSCSLLFIPVDLRNLVVGPKVLEHLLGSHQLEHGL